MTIAPASQPHTAPDGGAPLHHAGAAPHPVGNPLFDRLINKPRNFGDWAIRIVLVAVMTAALAVGTWSIYTLLTVVFGVPQFIAVLGCGMFDGAALFFALLSQRYATTTDSGFAPRTAMLAMICTSSWVNWQHAQLEHWGTVGGVILAAAPVIAELAFLMYHRFAHREALRALGRVPQALPALGKWAWLAHPGRSRKTLDAHIRAGLIEHEAVADRRVDLAGERARRTVSLPFEVDRTEGQWTVDRTGPLDRPAIETGRTADRGPEKTDRTESDGPQGVDRTADRRTATAKRTALVDRTAVDRAHQVRQTAGPDRETDRGPVQTQAGGPDHESRTADRDEADLVLTDLERTAIETLRTADRSISKRSIQDVIRNELGGSIASDRAVQIARHFRTLRSAA